MESVKDDISKPQLCDMNDMLRFLFSFCGAKADATEIKPMDREISAAFKAVRNLANEPGALPRNTLRSA